MPNTDNAASAPTIDEAITLIRTQVGPVGKGERNTQQGWAFRGVDRVVNAVARALNAYGVTISPVATTFDYQQIEVGPDRKPHGHVIVTVTYAWTGPAGDTKHTQTIGEAMDRGDKAGAKAMSVAYRTCILQTLSLPTGEEDPDQHIYERSDQLDPKMVETVELIDRAVADDDVNTLRTLLTKIPAAAQDLVADPATGQTLREYLIESGKKITQGEQTEAGEPCRCDRQQLLNTGKRHLEGCPQA